MTGIFKATACLCVVAFSLAVPFRANAQKEVSFASAFKAGQMGSAVVVQVPSSDVLVMEPGEYILNGRSLVVRAHSVVLKGDVFIRSYPPDSEAALKAGVGSIKPQKSGVKPPGCTGKSMPEGCDGADGDEGSYGLAPGIPGKNSGTFYLKAASFQPSGFKLKLIAEGQIGGRGQQGGTGQQGANGAEGRGQEGWPGCAGPWRGGHGGAGGPAGQGGQGGVGGAGGQVYLSQPLYDLMQAGHVTVSVVGGLGGKPGEPGAPGAGGGPGKTGPRTNGCTTPAPGPGTNGTKGSNTPISAPITSVQGAVGAVAILR